MTARHVLVGACYIRATLGNRSYTGRFVKFWSSDVDTVETADLATFKLDRPAPGYIFDVARRTPKRGATIAIVGHPLGNPLSLHQGRFLGTQRVRGIPTIAVWVAAAKGASGSPLLDSRGDVVGILQRGFVREDAGAVSGINLVRWWGPQIRRDLCDEYPKGRIPGCGDTKPPPPPPSPPPPPPPPPPIQTFRDGMGDAGTAPDITDVSVYPSAPGEITFRVVVPNRARLDEDDLVGVFIDADRSLATGSQGFDYLIVISLTGSVFARWDGTTFTPVTPTAPFSASFGGGIATVTIGRADLSNTSTFGFVVATSDSNSPSAAFDDAPNAGAWVYSP